MPSGLEEYTDGDGNAVDSSDENIIIMNMCLLTGMDLDGEITIECCHFVDRNDDNRPIPFFRGLKI